MHAGHQALPSTMDDNGDDDMIQSFEMAPMGVGADEDSSDEDLSRFRSGDRGGPSRRSASMGSESDTKPLTTMEVRIRVYLRRCVTYAARNLLIMAHNGILILTDSVILPPNYL